jgi:hypothetical protein
MHSSVLSTPDALAPAKQRFAHDPIGYSHLPIGEVRTEEG